MNTIRISFRRINRWAQGFVARRTRDTGLTPSQIQALRHIGYHKVMSQQELVEDDVIALEEAYYDWLLEGLEPEMRENFTRAMDLLLQRAKEGRRSCYCEIDAKRETDGDGSCT